MTGKVYTALIVLGAVVLAILIILAVLCLLWLRKRKFKGIDSDGDSDEAEEEEIVDRTGALTHFLCNTHQLDGTIFLPNHAGGAIY